MAEEEKPLTMLEALAGLRSAWWGMASEVTKAWGMRSTAQKFADHAREAKEEADRLRREVTDG